MIHASEREGVAAGSQVRPDAVSLCTVTADDAGIRLDRWFRRHLPHVPHALIERWLRGGQVRVDGRRVEASHRLEVGQVIRVPPHAAAAKSSGKPRSAAEAREVEKLRDAVLYRDDDLVILNKPPGLAVQGGSGTWLHLDGLLDGLAFGGERPRLVHRLDRDTSGVLLLARSARVADELAQAFRRHQVAKLYWAIVIGGPRRDEGRIDMPLVKVAGPRGDWMQAGQPCGDMAITDYSVIARAGRKFAWLALSPLTGRTHQLRVHCSTLGMPILGDFKYGLPIEPPAHLQLDRRLHLHARGIALPRLGREPLVVFAPPPPHMLHALRMLGFDAELPVADRHWPARALAAVRRG
jgi:23S rRNA pseudouridine955/2504/2580 synthase